MKRTKPKLKLSDDQLCFGCGAKNPRGLHLKFIFDENRRVLKTEWRPTKEFQGYADIVHGGMTAVVLDETMGNLLWRMGLPSVTAQITVRFLRPAKVDEPLKIEARVTSEKNQVIRMRGTARSSSRRLIATADAIFIRIHRPSRMTRRPVAP